MSATEAPSGANASKVSGGPGGSPVTSSALDPATALGQLGIAFRRATVAMRRLKGRETHRTGQLSYAQYGLLFGLSGQCECSTRELAEQADLSPATVTQMLESLENAGLVKRTRSEQDRRVVLSALTERGNAVVSERHSEMESSWKAALGVFSDDELTAAAKVLTRLADYFDALLGDTDSH